MRRYLHPELAAPYEPPWPNTVAVFVWRVGVLACSQPIELSLEVDVGDGWLSGCASAQGAGGRRTRG